MTLADNRLHWICLTEWTHAHRRQETRTV